MTTIWHVTVGFTANLSEDTPFDVMEDLEEHGAVVSVSRDHQAGSVTLTMDGDNLIDACSKAVQLVTQTLARHDTPAEATTVEAKTEEEFTAELATPIYPEVVGYAEVAQMAGVSRQRARQFADIEGFPEPAIVTAQGPLMTKSAVNRWLDTRHTRRPAKPVHA